jgi:polysaccharide export outer membrane protein
MRLHLLSTYLVAAFLLGSYPVQAARNAPQFANRDQRYRLQPGDVVEVQYRYTPEYNQAVNIQPDGFVTLQLLGDLKLGGLDLDQAHGAILALAAARFKDPEVTLALKEFDKPRFTVGGEVNTPGRFELRGPTTVLEAIAMAGGLKTASAKHSQVLLVRRVDEAYAETRVLDLKEMVNSRNFAEDQPLRAGDMLFVPQNAISKIERFVKWANVGVYAPLP